MRFVVKVNRSYFRKSFSYTEAMAFINQEFQKHFGSKEIPIDWFSNRDFSCFILPIPSNKKIKETSRWALSLEFC